ncbi:MAG: DUF2892 domain-containing protein [Proteobacteria bacterium]|nr:DUF2892 domain-containing protein [Pseudomonadota bacterium]
MGAHERERRDAEQVAAQNEHVLERALRIGAGLVLLSLVFVGPKTLWGLVGVVPLLTGLLGSCPLYTLLGVSTCPRPPAR